MVAWMRVKAAGGCGRDLRTPHSLGYRPPGLFSLTPIPNDPPEALSTLGGQRHIIMKASHGNPPNKLLGPPGSPPCMPSAPHLVP